MDRKNAFSHVAAVVLAAGFSTRMKRFKPLLPFGGGTVLSFAAGVWRRAGVEQICAVAGHKAELVEAEACRIGIACVRNARPEDGMYSSVRTGLAYALERFPQAAWFGVHPVDIPLIEPACVRALAERARTSQADCLAPAWGGRRGHPPLLSRRLAGRAVQSAPEGGLRALLDEAIVEELAQEGGFGDRDMDRPEDYERALAELASRGI